jgi:DNA-binding transcriptional ArsR family regulator
MGEYLDRTFAALADPSRRAILHHLRDGERRVTDLARPLPFSLNTVSKHVRTLERAGLVHRHVRGRDHFIALTPEPMHHAVQWLAQYRAFWTPRLDALERILREQPAAGGE